MPGAPLRVMLVDDHQVVREGLKALLGMRTGMKVVGEAASVAEAIEVAGREKPDVVVMDVRLPDGSGVEACREIRANRPETRMIMLTSYADDQAVVASIMAGASAYLLKQTSGQQVGDAILSVARGESLLDPHVTMRVLEQFRNLITDGGAAKGSHLTDQEYKILKLIAEGKTNKEIGAELYLSDKTIKNHVSEILSKLNLKRRSEAAAYIARRLPEHE